MYSEVYSDLKIELTREDGAYFPLSNYPLGVISIAGLEGSKVEIFAQKRAVGDGDIITGHRVASRNITVKLGLKDIGQYRPMRQILGAFLSSAFTYNVAFEYKGVRRIARGCLIKAMAMPTENIHHTLFLTITFFSPAGYLEGDGIEGADINAVAPRFGFPLVSLVENGFIFSKREFRRAITVDNTGHTPTYMNAVFTTTSTDGVLNPCLWLNNSLFVKVLHNLKKGEVLEIDTEQRTVRLNGKNSLRLMSKSSQIGQMNLPVGLSTVGFTSETNDTYLSVNLTYGLRYDTI